MNETLLDMANFRLLFIYIKRALYRDMEIYSDFDDEIF